MAMQAQAAGQGRHGKTRDARQARAACSGRGGALMRLALSLLLLCVITLPVPALADRAAGLRLLSAMRMDETLHLLRDEGLAYAATLGEDMLPGGNDPAWQRLADRIYDPAKMSGIVADAFLASFTADPAPLTGYFEGPDGLAILEAELSGRRAFLDKAVEEEARAVWAATDPEEPRQRQIAEYIRINGLIESNVAGALNSNLMFYRGLAEGDALALSEAEMLDEVWGQEEALRDDIGSWLLAYLTMAYAGLPDATLDGYVALSSTPEGQALNRALFAAFNRMHDEISFALGLALASRMQPGEDL